jgi:hypothetical protein
MPSVRLLSLEFCLRTVDCEGADGFIYRLPSLIPTLPPLDIMPLAAI